jgi:uncharacterized protein
LQKLIGGRDVLLQVMRTLLSGLFFVVWATFAAAEDEPRFALVIGNADYSFGALKNPVNDARSMAAVLLDAGFETTLLENVTADEFNTGVEAFLKDVPEGSVGLFYYAGHALQRDGRNLLLPVDISVEETDKITKLAVSASDLIEKFNAKGIGFGIFILDACRNNPFAPEDSETGRGLASMESDQGETLIGFATEAGAVAYDGNGPNSPYTGALITELDKPGKDILDVFRSVRRSVRIWTDGRQRPFIAASIERTFVFNPKSDAAIEKIDVGGITTDTVREVVEKIWWATIRDSKVPEDFRQFIDHFPESANVEQARSLALDLEANGQQARGLELVQFTVPEGQQVADGLSGTLTACDLSAADPDDPQRIADGVPWGLVNVRLALRDCSAAIAEEPTNPRLLHQMGRLLDIQNRWAEAEGFYRLAATMDYSASMVNLGYLFSAGQGRDQDYAEALKLYRKAADLGNLRARTNIGVFYERGWHVEKNFDEAVIWYRLAAQNGWPNALDTLGNLYRKGPGEDGSGLKKDVTEAIRLFRVAAELGNTNAMNNLGQLYLNGETGEPDVDQGVDWLQKAAERGNIYAPYTLGRAYRDGKGVKKDSSRAVEYFLQATDLGNVAARIALGQMYEEGRGLKKNPSEAAFHYIVASLIGDARKDDEVKAAEERLSELRIDESGLAEARARAEEWVRNNGR